MIIIVMGVSGSGKTTIGTFLAEEMGLPFYDADDFHSEKNVQKMRSGRPLDDEDRREWLERLARQIEKWSVEGGAVLACSALKRGYRQTMTSRLQEDSAVFVHLTGSPGIIRKRLEMREGHFMPVELLDSQLQALDEPPEAIVVTIDRPPGEIVRTIIHKLPPPRSALT